VVVAKAAAMEVTKHYNSSMVGSRRPVEVALYRVEVGTVGCWGGH
jgi:hypothetical protein